MTDEQHVRPQPLYTQNNWTEMLYFLIEAHTNSIASAVHHISSESHAQSVCDVCNS